MKEKVASMKEWSVEVMAAAPPDVRERTPSTSMEEWADRVVGDLAASGTAVAFLGDSYSVRLTVEASDANEAVRIGTERLRSVTLGDDAAEWPIVELRAQASDELDAELARSAPPLLGVAELAQRLNVTRQRASNLARSPSFPRPIALLASGPVWLESTVMQYIPDWDRRPGRKRIVH
jgi:predicted DNA-binding transcriptional regulator AlpA